MKFGPVPLSSAQGAILAHSLQAGNRLLRKGHLLREADIAALAREGLPDIIVARLEDGDVGEDEAAARIARAAAGTGVRTGAALTGRVNLYARADGIARIDAEKVAAINSTDESITIATVAPFVRVDSRRLLATIKVIPFAAPLAAIETIERILAAGHAVEVATFRPVRAALISTVQQTGTTHILGKTMRGVSARLHALGSTLMTERRVPHRQSDLAAAILEALAAGAELILISGACAITDRRDVIPAAVVEAGGTIERFGMPVDPGNLLLSGRIGGTTVIGLPGCARSPRRNGLDFVLERVLAHLPVDSAAIAAMGVGGLLAETAARSQPREAVSRAPAIAAIVLAAGLSSRMGRNKLTAEIRGQPLVRHAVMAALNSHASDVIVVTGNEEGAVRAALDGLSVQFVHNADFRRGLSTSLKAGIRAVPEHCDGAVVLLGDMPGVGPALTDRLIAAFDPEENRAICVATHARKRGNPVLWPRRFFPDILSLAGDVGAKHLIAENDDVVCDVEADDDGPILDIDTPAELAHYSVAHATADE